MLTVGVALQITCPEGYQACGGACYRLISATCSGTPSPKTLPQLDCLLTITSTSTLPVATAYFNQGGGHFSLFFDADVVAPAELEGNPGPGGDMTLERCVVVDRKQRRLVRMKCPTPEQWPWDDVWASVCESYPIPQ